MTFTHWNPLREMARTQQHFARFLNEALREDGQPQRNYTTWTPAVDVAETTEGYEFAFELPGVKPEAVEVEVKDNTLTVKGERKSVDPKDGARYLHRERPAGRFARVFRMSKPVNADGVAAAYKDGVLSISVPLSGEAKPRKIHVQG